MPHPDQPTFPSDKNGFNPGLTVREYFAAHVLSGVLAASANARVRIPEVEAATLAVKYADALIIKLNEGKK
jgi:hypothetical protein